MAIQSKLSVCGQGREDGNCDGVYTFLLLHAIVPFYSDIVIYLFIFIFISFVDDPSSKRRPSFLDPLAQYSTYHPFPNTPPPRKAKKAAK